MSTITTVKITADSDSAMVKAALGPLLQSSGGRWNLTLQNNGVEREFKFKTFQKTWEFMNAVAGEAASVKHHPEWSNVYNTTFIRWTTHKPQGLSMLDTQMAAFCDAKASELGELPPEKPAPGQRIEGATGADLADRAAKAAGECCK